MSGKKVLFYADGSSSLGIGHLVRALGLCLEINGEQIRSSFATSSLTLAKRIREQMQAFFNTSVVPFFEIQAATFTSWENHASAVFEQLLKLVKTQIPDVLVCDGKYPWSQSQIDALEEVCPVILIDNTSSASRFSSRAIFPTDHTTDEMGSGIDHRVLRTGGSWVWVHPAVKSILKDNPPKKEFEITITMGGADPQARTLKAIECLSNRNDNVTTPKFAVVIGEACPFRLEIEERLANMKNWSIFRRIRDLHHILARSRTAVCAFGITAYECYALKVPMYLTTHSGEKDADLAMFLERNPDAGKFVTLDDPREFTSLPTPRPRSDFGHLAENLTVELLHPDFCAKKI